jgi:hypothetical protein
MLNGLLHKAARETYQVSTSNRASASEPLLLLLRSTG